MTSSINNIYFDKIYFTKKKNMFGFDTFPVFLFLCAMFGVTISGCQLYLWGEHEIIEPVGQRRRSPPRDHPERSAKFSTNSVPLSEP